MNPFMNPKQMLNMVRSAGNPQSLLMQMAQMEARLTAKMDANEIQSLRDQICQLQLQNAVAGVVRYPDTFTYNAGNSPFCNSTTGASA